VVVRGVLALMVGYLNNVHVRIYSSEVDKLIWIVFVFVFYEMSD